MNNPAELPELRHHDFKGAVVSLRSPTFNEDLIASLDRFKIVFLIDLSQRLIDTYEQLSREYQAFLQLPSEEQAPFIRDGSTFSGFHPYDSCFAGSRGVDRFMIPVDQLGVHFDEYPQFSDSVQDLYEEVLEICHKTAAATDQVLTEADRGKLKALLDDMQTCGFVLQSYHRFTPGMLEKFAEQGTLEITADKKQAYSFYRHKDIGALTLAFYHENNTTGLQLHYPSNQDPKRVNSIPLQLNEITEKPCVVLFLGVTMEQDFSSRRLEAIEHSVVVPTHETDSRYHGKRSTFFFAQGSTTLNPMNQFEKYVSTRLTQAPRVEGDEELQQLKCAYDGGLK